MSGALPSLTQTRNPPEAGGLGVSPNHLTGGWVGKMTLGTHVDAHLSELTTENRQLTTDNQQLKADSEAQTALAHRLV